jgi:hypothetical protein
MLLSKGRLVPKNDSAFLSWYPIDTLAEVRISLLAEDVFISDGSPHISPFPFSTFDFLGRCVVEVISIHVRIHDEILLRCEKTKNRARLLKRRESEIIF